MAGMCGTPSSAFAAKLMERGKLSAAEALEETLRNYTNRASAEALIAVSSWKLAIRGSTMGLHWFKGPKIVVEVSGGEILVTMPGTSLSVVYEKTDDNQLIANSFSARKDEKRKVSLPKFLALAWTAANEKAKQLGWIP